MRIISKFKDYYDSVQAYGQDSNLVYLRKQEEIILKEDEELISEMLKDIPSFPSVYKAWHSSNKISIIGFCGKLYPVWSYNDEIKIKRNIGGTNTGTYTTEKEISGAVYNSDEALQVLKKYKTYKDYLKTFNKSSIGGWRVSFNKHAIDVAVQNISKNTKLDKYFWDNKVPTFLVTRNRHRRLSSDPKYMLILNPNLSDWNFYKVKDAYTAYQDISMYLSGVLGLNDPETVSISDKDMKSQKGFGHKYAFKTEPSKYK